MSMFEGIPPYTIRFLTDDLRYAQRTIEPALGAPDEQILRTEVIFDYAFLPSQRINPEISLDGPNIGYVSIEVLIKTDTNTLSAKSIIQRTNIKFLMETIVVPF